MFDHQFVLEHVCLFIRNIYYWLFLPYVHQESIFNIIASSTGQRRHMFFDFIQVSAQWKPTSIPHQSKSLSVADASLVIILLGGASLYPDKHICGECVYSFRTELTTRTSLRNLWPAMLVIDMWANNRQKPDRLKWTNYCLFYLDVTRFMLAINRFLTKFVK